MSPNARQIKQLLAIDQLLGMSSVPVKKVGSGKGEVGSKQKVESRKVESQLPTSDFPLPTSRTPAAPAAARVIPPVDDRPLAELKLTMEERVAALAQLDAGQVSVCKRCELCKTRNRTVFGEGDAGAKIMFVGEGPGADEDEQGRPFVGRAGQLLDKQIAAMGLEREQVYIANIVKCRPPGNRVPTPDEASVCQPYLDQQIAIIHPRVIVALGATAAKYLLNDPKLAITRERGTWREYRGIKLMPTFHPAYLLRSYTPENRKRVWDDLKKVMAEVGLEVPK